jgi:hypothetical protein
MKFTFKNLGKLDEAIVDLKDFNLICGENNTGKTYLLYSMYGFLEFWRSKDWDILPQNLFDTLKEQRKIEIPFEEILNKERLNKILKEVGSQYQNAYISSDFKAPKKFFESTIITPYLTDEDLGEIKAKYNLMQERTLHFNKVEANSENSDLENPIITIKIKVSLGNLTIALSKENLSFGDSFVIRRVIESWLKGDILGCALPIVSSFCTSERTGIITFQKQLNRATLKMMRMIEEASFKKDSDLIEHLIKNDDALYPKPIMDELDFIQIELPKYMEQQSKLSLEETPAFIKELNEILGGELIFNASQDEILFQPKGTTQKKAFKTHLVSSSVRSLINSYFYLLKNGVKGNQILMIDEPEMNLHPKNQRAMARFLASLVNQGIKVMVSTHSDYLVRELNHLTALHKFQDQDSVKTYLADEKNPYSEEVLISPDQVGLYYTTEDSVLKKGNKIKSKGIVLKKVEPNAYGAFDVDSFDCELQDLNQTGETIVNLIHPLLGEEA